MVSICITDKAKSIQKCLYRGSDEKWQYYSMINLQQIANFYSPNCDVLYSPYFYYIVRIKQSHLIGHQKL